MFNSVNSQFSSLVARATSELLPSEDIAANLQVCDFLRAKKIPANQAAKILKDRLSNKNPNVQLLTLTLIEMCVKNCGSGFHVEVASKDFVDNLVGMVKFSSMSNNDVKHRILELIQAWGIAFRGRPNMTYVCDIYNQLRSEGMGFPPPRSELTDIPLGATTAPDWSDSDVCMRCRAAFTVIRRKHHCRNCGQTFCNTCCSKKIALPEFGLEEEERVCDGCYDAKMNKGSPYGNYSAGAAASPYSSNPYSSSAVSSSPYSGYSQPSFQTSSNSYPGSYSQPAISKPADDFDAELKKALELSLQEASKPSQVRYTPPAKQTVVFDPEADEDPDLAAAIAASLSDITISSTERVSSYAAVPKASAPSSAPPASSKKPSKPQSQSHELSETEKNSISLFSKLIYKIEQNGDSVIGNRDIQDLYSEICVLHPKLIADLEETDEKLRNATAMSEQITKIVDLYNRIIEERMAYVARRTEYAPIETRSMVPPAYPPSSSYAPNPSYSAPPSSSSSYSAPPSNYSYPSNPNYAPPPSSAPPSSNSPYPPSSSNPASYAPSNPNYAPPSSSSSSNAPYSSAPPSSSPSSSSGYPAAPSQNYSAPANATYPGYPQQFAQPSYPNSYAPPSGQVQYPPSQNQYPPMQNQYASPSSLLIDI